MTAHRLIGFHAGRVVRPAILGLVMVAAGLASARPARADVTLNVTTTSDVINDHDGKCSLREAVRAVNNTAPSGSVSGECPAGTYGTYSGNTIVLKSGKTYKLTKSSGGLDIMDPGGGASFFIETT